jgi:hypothetical protein
MNINSIKNSDQECIQMRSNQIFLTIAVLMIALLLGACGPAANSQAASVAQIPQITIKAADYAFDAPAQIEAGLVTITLVNDGREPHHAQIIRLNDGVTLEQLQTAFRKARQQPCRWQSPPAVLG